MKNKKTTTTTAEDPCHSTGKVFLLFQRLFPGQGFPQVFRATFIFCPCPSHCERTRSPGFLSGCADTAGHPRASEQCLHSLVRCPSCPPSKESQCGLPRALCEWSWLQSQSHVRLNHSTSDHRASACPAGCCVSSLPYKVRVLPSGSLETFFLPAAPQAKNSFSFL